MIKTNKSSIETKNPKITASILKESFFKISVVLVLNQKGRASTDTKKAERTKYLWKSGHIDSSRLGDLQGSHSMVVVMLSLLGQKLKASYFLSQFVENLFFLHLLAVYFKQSNRVIRCLLKLGRRNNFLLLFYLYQKE